MRKPFSVLASLATASLVLVGCAGPEAKLGRGIRNVTEFTRGGEIARSVEQTSLFASPEEGMTTGLIHGFNRSVARTAVGAYEILTFPFPSYDPIYQPVATVYPDSYRPGLPNEPFLQTDVHAGFDGGEVAPFIPGSRFKIFND